jgi:hypothetical protein
VDARASDGSHLTRAGGEIVARLLLRHLDRDREPQAASAAPSAEPAGSSPVGSVPRDQLADGRVASSGPAVPVHHSTAPYTYSVIALVVLVRVYRRIPPARIQAARALAVVAVADAAAAGRAALAAGQVALIRIGDLRLRLPFGSTAARDPDRVRTPPASPAPPALPAPPEPPGPPPAPPVPLPEVITVSGPVQPGAFCSIEGSWSRGADGRVLRCIRPPEGGRARWRPPA